MITTIQRQEIIAAVRVCEHAGIVTKAEAQRAIASLRDENKAGAGK
ncbi:hypothetical protein VT930_11835 [Mycobacterium sherrisii]|nr:hypothetical protein [Mycobacterium sherrisii]MEC4763794.1 hypothetical protein [Mycobacterium sherrisii]